MFAAHLRCVYRTCDKIIVRTLRGNSYVPKGPNPGLDNRIGAFKEEGLQITDNDAEEFVEQSDSDFYQVGEAYNEHLNETLIGKYEMRQQIVKDKYFKQNMPNLLTWSEKEQIRHLHNEHPDEWTLEKLAESFPVTVPVLKKLIKYPWKPATEERIARHDATVMRNWKELKEGSLDISKALRDHFLKFSNRSIPPLKKQSIKIDLTYEKDIGEFESIVKRCAAQEETKKTSSFKLNLDESTDKLNEKRDHNRFTLKELTSNIKKQIDTGKEVNVPDQIIVHSVNANLNTITQNSDTNIEIPSDVANEVVEYRNKGEDDKSIMEYPERIRIPKKAYKKGATYKVNDCYYDHDGKFLYRVLGMSK